MLKGKAGYVRVVAVPRRTAAVLACAVAIAALLAAGCVEHPGLPALDHSDYVAKASLTAEDAISTLSTSVLLLDTVAADRAFDNYVSSALDDQVDRLEGVASSFEAVEPPEVRSRALRVDMVQALEDAQDHLGQVVTAYDAGDTAFAVAMRDTLRDDITTLQKFVKR